MSTKKRLVYFGLGLFIGIVFVKIIFDKKDVEFDYLPNDRVLKTLKTKKRVFEEPALYFFKNESIDTSLIALFFEEGDVNFSASKQREKPCNYYQIEKTYRKGDYGIWVKNCDSLVTIEKAFKINLK